MQSYEVEVKSLLGSADRAEAVRVAMKKVDPSCILESKNKQLNHYFEPDTQKGGSLDTLATALSPHLSGVAEIRLQDLATRAKSFSVRTRDKNGIVLIVVKASVGDDTSANGVTRMEFEEKVPLPLDALDKLVISAGFAYQAKWSREREEYLCSNVTVCLDKNAGYGWLAEFERVVDNDSKLDSARQEIRKLMADLGVEELPQDRLERMFSFYNAHWPEYYGTEKIFDIK
jgi:predicted adenylyl cyclase CyaB